MKEPPTQADRDLPCPYEFHTSQAQKGGSSVDRFARSLGRPCARQIASLGRNLPGTRSSQTACKTINATTAFLCLGCMKFVGTGQVPVRLRGWLFHTSLWLQGIDGLVALIVS